jgi:hypothetical protein
LALDVEVIIPMWVVGLVMVGIYVAAIVVVIVKSAKAKEIKK